MEDTLSFLFLCATGVACYWFFFKCVDWFEKIYCKKGELNYVFSTVYTLLIDLRVFDVCPN